MNEAFSRRLKHLRKERGKTQQQIADYLGVLRSTYGEYERGKIAPPMDKLQALGAYFGVTVDYLIAFGANAPEDVSESLEHILDVIQRQGAEWDEDSRQLLINSIENSLKMVKILKKGRK